MAYLQIEEFFLVCTPYCIVQTIVIGNQSDTLVCVSLVAVVWLVELVAGIPIDSFWYSLC